MRKTLCLTVIATLALTACNNDSSSGSSSLSAFVLNLFARDTTETALPVDLASVTLDTSSDDSAPYASLFAPGG